MSQHSLSPLNPQPTTSTPHSLFAIRYSLFAIFAVILLLAAFLRLAQLPTLPPGLNFDEAGSGVAALEILSGAPKIWWRLGGGQEPVWPYLAALSTAILGNIPLALRLPAALSGILTVAAVYPLMLALRPGASRFETHLIALLTALGLALSAWHLHFSRLGFRAILLPLFSTLAFYFFWCSLGRSQKSEVRNQKSEIRSQKSVARYFLLPGVPDVSLALSALFTALAIYSYLAARLLPLVPLLFFLLQGLIIWLRQTLSRLASMRRDSRQLFSTNSPPSRFVPFLSPTSYFLLLTSYFLLLTLFLSPLLLYFAFNPADFVARSTAVSIFNPTWNQGDLLGTAWHTLTVTLGTFLGLQGDPNPLVNLPGQPALPLILVPFFVIGLLISLYRSFSPAPLLLRSPAAAHLFLLCWWVVMLLPAILAPEGAPHHLRLIGTIVPTYAFVAIGLTSAATILVNILRLAFHIPRYVRLLPTSYFLLPTLCYLLLSFQTYTNYFVRWPASVDFNLPFDLYAVRLADDIAHAPPGVGYVLPMDLRAGEEARHYTLDYLLWFHQPRPYTYVPVDERDIAALLTQAAAGKTQLRVVRWTGDKQREADAKEIVTYLLETSAQFQGRESFPVCDIETYTLPNTHTVFALPAITQPIGANFDNLLRLDVAYVPPSAAPGSWLPVALTLTPLAPMGEDYKASLRLLGPTGARVAQKDRILLHNFHQGTSLWPPETVNEHYLLPIPQDALPGEYTVTLLIYHPETLSPLVAAGLVEVPLGRVNLR